MRERRELHWNLSSSPEQGKDILQTANFPVTPYCLLLFDCSDSISKVRNVSSLNFQLESRNTILRNIKNERSTENEGKCI